MTGNRGVRRAEAPRATANEAVACELVDKLCAPSKLVVREEQAMVAMRLNMEFLACESVADVAAFAEAVFRHNPSVIDTIHNAIQEGDACVHILLDLGFHLTHSASACAAACQAGVVETLVGVLPMLTTPALVSALQLLDRVTDDDDDARASSDRGRRRRLAVQRLCRVACVRALWNVLAADRSSPQLTLALSLLAKTTAAVETAKWAGGSAATQQLVAHTLQRTPPVEATLKQLLAEDDGHDADRRHLDPHARAIIGGLLARVQRWRGAKTTRPV